MPLKWIPQLHLKPKIILLPFKDGLWKNNRVHRSFHSERTKSSFLPLVTCSWLRWQNFFWARQKLSECSKLAIGHHPWHLHLLYLQLILFIWFQTCFFFSRVIVLVTKLGYFLMKRQNSRLPRNWVGWNSVVSEKIWVRYHKGQIPWNEPLQTINAVQQGLQWRIQLQFIPPPQKCHQICDKLDMTTLRKTDGVWTFKSLKAL